MPMPMDVRNASEDFEIFLTAVLEESGLGTRNQVYTMTEGVLRAFRRRLTVEEALRFAGGLPPVLRAIFVADWDVGAPRLPFDRAAMTREAQDLRRDHNFASDTAIRDVAVGLDRVVDRAAFARVLKTLPTEAAAFWQVS